jgi:hypothetical protein
MRKYANPARLAFPRATTADRIPIAAVAKYNQNDARA